ncbi:FtsX-like permease family protein [Arthrobacter sp. AOP36-A1-22]|uniref:FtsX-like permease family protein n=1 Tax=Arthrobacter sp. AOP36-A1-22 TaxID=3457684 RepID=UPI0040334A20
MWSTTLSALRAHRSSFIGSFLIVLLAAALLSATGVYLAAGLNAGASGSPVSQLLTVAGSFAGTALILVVLVLSQTFAASLRQRQQQFALLRAIGATSAQIRSMITAEVFAVFCLAAPLGAIPGLYASGLLLPLLRRSGIVPAGFEPTINALPAVGAVVVLLATSLLTAHLGARSLTRVSPMEAVSGSAMETPVLSPVRRISAWSFLAAGSGSSVIPIILPNTIGSASGASSAFLLVAAAALGGPAMIGWVARAAVRLFLSGPAGPAVLAIANTRGFSLRLTTAIIPLALLLALGTVQSGVGVGTVGAAGLQLREGLEVNLVVSSPTGLGTENATEVGQVPGVESAMASSTVPVSTKLEDDDEDLALFNDFLWEPGALRTVGDHPGRFLDPGLTQGRLEDLSTPGTIAVSDVATLGTGKGLNDALEVRFGDGSEHTLAIAAIYRNGLGFGDFIINEDYIPATNRPDRVDSVLVNTTGSGAAAASASLASRGYTVSSVADYAEQAVISTAEQQRLSNALLLVLVLFVALAAGNTLVMLTGARKNEFTVLKRLGATRSQLRFMVFIESGFVAVSALVIGTLCVLPALFGVGYGLLGGWAPAVDWQIYGALAAAVVSIAVGTMGLSAWAGTRDRSPAGGRSVPTAIAPRAG